MRNNTHVTPSEALKFANIYGFAERGEKLAPVPAPANDDTFKAVYPRITGQAFHLTMENYRQFVSANNDLVKKQNTEIQQHNALVQIYKKENEVTPIQQAYLPIFLKKNKDLPAALYNEKVHEFCQTYGNMIEKKEMQPIKPPTELLFQNFLHLYDTQLRRQNDIFKARQRSVQRPLQPFSLRADKVTSLKRNGVKSVNYCNKTVRNHRARLQEAGILTDYVFKGRFDGVELLINPQILVVFDEFTQKLSYPENQQLKNDKRKILPHHKEGLTRTLIEILNKRDNATQLSNLKVFSAKTSLELQEPTTETLDRNTVCAKQINFTGGAAPENVKVLENDTFVSKAALNSKDLEALLLPVNKLDENLRKGMYDNYAPIPIKKLYDEAVGGVLTNQEYYEIVCQDMLKSLAKLYRGRAGMFAGTWANAYKLLQLQYFRNQFGPWNKFAIWQQIEQMRWRIDYARRWFLKAKIQPLYPSNYLDKTRKDKKEMGFEYTTKAWQGHVRDVQERPAKMAKLKKAAELRKIQINNAKKYEGYVNRFMKGRLTITQLTEYVQHNLPADFEKALNDFLDKKILENNWKC